MAITMVRGDGTVMVTFLAVFLLFFLLLFVLLWFDTIPLLHFLQSERIRHKRLVCCLFLLFDRK